MHEAHRASRSLIQSAQEDSLTPRGVSPKDSMGFLFDQPEAFGYLFHPSSPSSPPVFSPPLLPALSPVILCSLPY